MNNGLDDAKVTRNQVTEGLDDIIGTSNWTIKGLVDNIVNRNQVTERPNKILVTKNPTGHIQSLNACK